MTAFQQAEALLPSMTIGERAELASKAYASASGGSFLGIEKTEGVCGGSACVIRTRVTVWAIISYFQVGVSDQEMLENFPSLRQQDLENARHYYQSNKAEIDHEIFENTDESESF